MNTEREISRGEATFWICATVALAALYIVHPKMFRAWDFWLTLPGMLWLASRVAMFWVRVNREFLTPALSQAERSRLWIIIPVTIALGVAVSIAVFWIIDRFTH